MKAMQSAILTVALVAHSTQILAASIIPRQLYPTCAFFGYSIKDSFAATDAGTYIGCSAACLAEPQCKSFAFDTQSHKDCQLYDVYVDDNINLEYGSPYYFYDIGCETKHTCGELGDTYRWEPFDYSNNTTNQQCIDKCLSLSNCKSYAYGNSECFIYDTIVYGNIKPRADSPYNFFDSACLSSSTTSTTSATRTSTGTSTKSSVKTSSTSSSAGKSSTTSTAARTSTTTVKTSASSTSSSKTTSSKGSSTTRVSSTSAKILSTSVTISNQAYFCTAVN